MTGKVVVVTGASMGIGEAIAKIFADRGASLVLLSRDSNRVEAARARMGSAERTIALGCDVRHREEVDRVLGLVLHHFQRIDVWVNNAGVGMRDTLAAMDVSKCRELFDVNFFGAIHCMQAVIPVMKQAGGGTIINISSVAGHIPVGLMSAYSASKFALTAAGKAARLELEVDNIHVLTVCPGYVRTDFGANVISARGGSLKPKPVRGITAERVARAVYEGFRKRKREVIVPWYMHLAVKLHQLLPGIVEWGMKRGMQRAAE